MDDDNVLVTGRATTDRAPRPRALRGYIDAGDLILGMDVPGLRLKPHEVETLLKRLEGKLGQLKRIASPRSAQDDLDA